MRVTALEIWLLNEKFSFAMYRMLEILVESFVGVIRPFYITGV